MAHFSQLGQISLACGFASALILVAFLVRRPAITHAVKVWLLLGVGVLPLGAATTGNIQGYLTTEHRSFCGSCHVMSRHASDSEDPKSMSLAARHARNKLFGEDNCYMCHADYGMYGTVLTKMGGMRHVWLYYTEYRNIPLEQALPTIHLREPYPNRNCMECHSTQNVLWLRVPEHESSLDDVRADRISCASGGCHGYAHPFDKPDVPKK
ncbi:MAG TPA: NapC/NirT family cytochrome c [Polyangiaceae bacterium]|jgi:cytochrome c-type protein NapC